MDSSLYMLGSLHGCKFSSKLGKIWVLKLLSCYQGCVIVGKTPLFLGGGVLKLQIDQHLSSIHLVLNKMNITSSSWQERGILIVQDTIWKVDRGKKLWLISWVQSKAWRHSWFFLQTELDWLVTCLFFLLVCFFPLGWNGREKNSRHWSVLLEVGLVMGQACLDTSKR